MEWPGSFDQLIRGQQALAALRPVPWTPPPGRFPTGGCFVCFSRGQPGEGAKADLGWAGATLISSDRNITSAVTSGSAGAPYEAGLLALREGPLLEAAVRSLPRPPEVLLVNATGRDHPRSAGLAVHLGAVLDLPTVGITQRPLLAEGEWPELARGARVPLHLAGEEVGFWLCTRNGTRPLAVHAAWRTDAEVAVAEALRATTGEARTPEPIRHARRVARTARAAASGA